MSPGMIVTLYGNRTCPYCGAARMLLTRKGIAFDDVVVSDDPALLEEMRQKSGRSSVPQVFIGDRHVGGFDELDALAKSGELDELLSGEAAGN
ncbi:MAG: glutaredoxin 3 [Gammaproteobacteria bacterium]|nr:glutaredoxin 3 [Gammaproteobacteria bacterium]